MTAPLLYVHPYNHVLDELVPMGAVALLNRVRAPKLGRFAWELTEEELGAAGVLAMDLHWYFSIEAVRWIAAHAKRLRPDLPIILGGITASFYARHLIEHFPIDYVVQGDGEESFPQLVETLLDGRQPPPLPNVWSRGGAPPQQRPVPAEHYDDNDYLDLSWFPALERYCREGHQRYAVQPFWGEMDRYHPYVPLNRGCRFPCGMCFGSWQREVFGHGQVDRGAASLERLLDGAEAHPDYRFVNLTAGTEDVARLDAYRGVLGRKRALGAYVMHFCTLPGDADLQLFLDGFERVCIDFTNPADVPLPLRAQGYDIPAAQQRILDICQALDGEERVRVGVSFLDHEPAAFKDRLRAFDWDRVQLKENSEWALPRPDLRTLGKAPDIADIDRLPVAASSLDHGPIPEVARRGLSPQQQQVRDAAKAAQAEGFREVSSGHARYLVARALSPGLHPLLDLSTLQQVNGQPVHRLQVDDAVAGWLAAYTTRFQHWHVTTLDRVEIVVAAAGDPVDAPGFHPIQRWGPDLGLATIEEAFDGLRFSWQGSPPPAPTLVLRAVPIIAGHRLDPRQVADLPQLALPLSAQVEGVLSAHHCRVQTAEGVTFSWQASSTRPDGPFLERPGDGPAPGFAGPTDRVEQPWPDESTAARFGQALASAEAAGRLGPWTGQEIECSTRWLRRDLRHADGALLRIFVLPPGEAPCAHATPHGRLLVQEAETGATAEPARQALYSALEAVLDSVLPDSVLPDSVVPDSVVPDSVVPDSVVPDSAG